MASLLASIMTKIDGLDPTGFPLSTVPQPYENQAPQVMSGLPVNPPYLIVEMQAVDDFLTFESDEVEVTRATFTAYYLSQADADQAIKAIRFNNQPKSSQAGLQDGTLPALTEGVLLSFLSERVPVPGLAKGGLSKTGVNVYTTVWVAVASVQRT